MSLLVSLWPLAEISQVVVCVGCILPPQTRKIEVEEYTLAGAEGHQRRAEESVGDFPRSGGIDLSDLAYKGVELLREIVEY